MFLNRLFYSGQALVLLIYLIVNSLKVVASLSSHDRWPLVSVFASVLFFSCPVWAAVVPVPGRSKQPARQSPVMDGSVRRSETGISLIADKNGSVYSEVR